jgi:cytochrome c biogenesis factor
LVTGIQATITNGGAVAGSSVVVSTTGVSLQTFIGEEDINVGVPVTGIQLSITNKTSTQDTLTAFGEAPFATLSPSTFNIPSVTIEATTGAGQLPSFLLQSTLGTFSVTADGNVSVVVTEHTMNTSVGDVSITGTANVSVTGTEMTMSMGEESAFTDHTVEVTGQQLTMSMGEEVPTADANVSLTGIQLTSSIGTATQETRYNVTGVQMSTSIGSVTVKADADVDVTGVQLQTNTGTPNITAWAEINPGVSNIWTDVDLAA